MLMANADGEYRDDLPHSHQRSAMMLTRLTTRRCSARAAHPRRRAACRCCGSTPTATTPVLMAYGPSTFSLCPRAVSASRTAAGTRFSISQHARLARVVVERAERVQRVDARRLDRLLDVLAEHDHLQQHVQDLLILAVAARRADREERLAVLQHDRRRQRGARPLAADEHVRAEPDRDRTPSSGSTAARRCRRR